MIFPDPVRANLFLAPELVFIFGIAALLVGYFVSEVLSWSSLAAADAAAAKAAADAAAAARNANTLSHYSIVFYDYSMSKLTSKDKTRLELMADVIKDGPKDRVYTIVGHADQQTGTSAGNRRVADNRAKNVYDFLVKCGVNPKQLTYEGKGNAANVYENNQKANRAVIIK